MRTGFGSKNAQNSLDSDRRASLLMVSNRRVTNDSNSEPNMVASSFTIVLWSLSMLGDDGRYSGLDQRNYLQVMESRSKSSGICSLFAFAAVGCEMERELDANKSIHRVRLIAFD